MPLSSRLIPPSTRKVLLSVQLDEASFAKVLQIAKETGRKPASVLKYLVEAGIACLEKESLKVVQPGPEEIARAEALALRQAKKKEARRKKGLAEDEDDDF